MPITTRVAAALAALTVISILEVDPVRAADPGQLPAALSAAADEAREVDTVRSTIVGAIQHGDGDENGLIVENTRESWPSYNRFASSTQAELLTSFAGFMYVGLQSRLVPAQEYRVAACPYLKPLLAVAAAMERMRAAGGELNAGYVLVPCSQDYCVPAAVEVVESECEFSPFLIPVQQP